MLLVTFRVSFLDDTCCFTPDVQKVGSSLSFVQRKHMHERPMENCG